MIKTFKDKETEAIYRGNLSKKLPKDIQRVAQRKLLQIHYATKLTDLRIPPGNRLEALERDRMSQHSIRINDQWRICFVWQSGDAYKVEITDYH